MLDAYATAAAVRAGELDPVDVTEAALAAIAARDPALNAVPVVLADRARMEARAVAGAVAAGSAGRLAGVPVTIKDAIWLRGAPATNGSAAFRHFVPAEDSACVARLRAGGAVVVGKTNNPEFCYRGFTDNAVYGLTRNPWDLGRTPGGSSGGAGASVAAGMAPLALGTDGGGSIRIPASFCGVAGHKPTFGLVPAQPGFRGWPTLSVHGPLARSVRDLALALAVLAGPAAADPLSWPGPPVDPLAAVLDERDLTGLRIAVSPDLGGLPVDPQVRARFAAAVERFAASGADLVEATPATAPPMRLWGTIAAAEGYASEGPLLADWADAMTPGTAELVRAGERLSAADYLDAQHERGAYTRVWLEFFEQYDLLLAPATQLPAFPVGVVEPLEIDGQQLAPGFDDWCGSLLPANLTGCPATAVPIGLTDTGLPVGMQILGPRGADASTLRAAAVWERLAPWAGVRPAERGR